MKDYQSFQKIGLFKTDKIKVGERRQMEIVSHAITAFAKEGYSGVTMQSLATSLNLSRQAILHYFSTKEEIYLVCVKFVRIKFQEYAIDYFSEQQDPEDMLRAYLYSTFDWIIKKRQHAQLLFDFLNAAHYQKHFRKIHQELTNTGKQRIASLVSHIHGDTDPSGYTAAAELIQSVITGQIVYFLTSKVHDKSYLREAVTEQMIVFARQAKRQKLK